VDHVQVPQQQPSPLLNPNITSYLTPNITAALNLTAADFAPLAYNVSKVTVRSRMLDDLPMRAQGRRVDSDMIVSRDYGT